MQTKTVVQSIDAIYDRFRVLPNLRLHMKRVAGILSYLENNWNGPPLDREMLIACGLLHDMGNITKVDWAWSGQEAMMGAEWERKEYWKKVQQDVFTRYGDEHSVVTANMLRELDVDSRIINIIHNTGYKNLPNVTTSTDWYVKLLVYADMRCAPKGIVSIDERMSEGRKRYAQLHPRVSDTEGFLKPESDSYLESIRKVEEEIQNNVTVGLEEINDSMINF